MKTTKTPDHNPTGRTRPKRKMGTVLRAKLSKYRAKDSYFFYQTIPITGIPQYRNLQFILYIRERFLYRHRERKLSDTPHGFLITMIYKLIYIIFS